MGYGIGMALKGWNQGVEDNRRRQREDENQQWIQEDRAAQQEQRDYQKGLRPLHERALNAQVDNAETGAEKNKYGLGLMRQKAPYEMDALKRQDELGNILLDMKRSEHDLYKRFQGAKSDNEKMTLMQERAKLETGILGQAYQRFKLGDGRGAAKILNEMAGNGIKNAADVIEQNGKVIVVDASGKPVVSPDTGRELTFDAAQLESQFGPKKTDRYSMSDGTVLDKWTGKTNQVTGGGPGADKRMDSKVELTNGQVVKESDVLSMYRNEWGTTDPNNPMVAIMKPDAPSYLAFRNSLVTGPYKMQSPQAYEQQYGQSPEEQAQSEASKDLGILDYVPFVNPDQEKVGSRAQEISQERASRTARGMPAAAQNSDTGVDWNSPTFKNMQWKAGNGSIITMDKILTTAKNRNMTPEQVMEKIGLDPKSVAAKAQ